MRRRPSAPYAPQGIHWSFASVRATGADQVRPRSNDWLTTTSEFVFATYGSVGAGRDRRHRHERLVQRAGDHLRLRPGRAVVVRDRAVDARVLQRALVAEPE